jgi:hypothetical protein
VDVVLGTNGTCSSVPVGKPLRFLGPASNTMLSVWFSSQILNCFLDSLHRSGLLQMVVNKDTAGGKFAGFLETKFVWGRAILD